MSFSFLNLDERTRQFMLEEVKHDVASDAIYISNLLNPHGVAAYVPLLIEAARDHDEVWLTFSLPLAEMFNPSHPRRNPKTGISSPVTMPINAPERLAEGEFNRFYIRALCRRAIDDGIPQLEIYRAKAVMNARSASQAKIGTFVSPEPLLNDLRTNVGVDTALGLPPGPNSGLSAKLP